MAGPRYRWKLIREVAAFARANRLYWLVPLVLFLVLTAVVVVVGQAAAPLIYTLF